MTPCHPTRVLRDQHVLILQVVDALEAMLERGEGASSADDVREFVGFFRLYTDRAHHGKEEDLLFESLVEQGIPREAGPVARMLEEHRIGRDLVRRMAEGAGAFDGDPTAWREVEEPARSYIDLLRDHILKEDHALFEMADNMIDEPACRRLCDAYDVVCQGRFEGKTLKELEGLGAELVARYPG